MSEAIVQISSYIEAIPHLKQGETVCVRVPAENGTVYEDRITGVPQLLILGCGHVGACTAKFGKELGYHVIMADPRAEFADVLLHPYADEVLCMPYEHIWDKVRDIRDCYTVLSIGDPVICLASAKEALHRKGVYVGMLGSRKKTSGVRSRLAEEFSEEELSNRFYAPIGIPLGGERPAEVALSILAEITRCRCSGKPADLEKDILEYLLAKYCSRAVDSGDNTDMRDSSDPLGILARILDVRGTAPRSAGSRMLYLPDGTIRGTIGGGDVEYETMQYAARMLDSGKKTAVITCVHGGHAEVDILLSRIDT